MLFFLAVVLAAAGQPQTLTGVPRTVKAGAASAVLLVLPDGATPELTGDLVGELRNLVSVKIEVTGHYADSKFVALDYRIIDLGRGVTPFAVGTLVEYGTALAVQDGTGTPIPLSLSPKLREKLSRKLGAKLWVVGQKLLSGEVKVTQFGILREPPLVQAPEAN